jgi:hypothetical protein
VALVDGLFHGDQHRLSVWKTRLEKGETLERPFRATSNGAFSFAM